MRYFMFNKLTDWLLGFIAQIIGASGGAVAGGAALATAVLTFIVVYRFLPPALEWMLGWFGRNVLGLSEDDFCGVKATTGHMSSMWSYENSAKGKRDARRRLEEETHQPGEER